MTSVVMGAESTSKNPLKSKWVQLALGVICMMSISSPQYVWALFTKPIMGQLGVTLTELQITFSILIVLQTFFSPFQGYLVDKFGPRLLLSIGTILTGASWVLSANLTTVSNLYLTYGVLGGLGTGIVYIGVVGLMVRWFPNNRGFAVGMVAAGYGIGALLTTFPISTSLTESGIQGTLTVFGYIIGAVGLLAAQGIRVPHADRVQTADQIEAAATGVAPKTMLKTPVFWLMFLMMSMMSTSGLMVISQMGAFAKDFGITSAMVFGMAALPLALTIDRVTNGLTRPIFGWVSDRIGREYTMTIAFGLEAVAMFAWVMTRSDPVMFVLLSGIVFFGWGEIFSLFPSTLTDTFGQKHATTNYGFLYMAQGVGSIVGAPVAAYIHGVTDSWLPVFAIMIVLDATAAILAFFVLRPMRAKYMKTLAA
ncbi:oxalate/formate MFS antiporter [Polynucleobacter sp. Ross1-W9]|uniref:oxalate/formate MFS antiporter n=1 Tax=Polynucleobacter parvulilacunae TaxID=1855631 RepID=UPI001C0E419F|nr:oxalate/formate MFS antiporter [Polynucleobacter parvulilacunae]MBU3556988.1 oxalate/formate MFS antiporter [Polynucleobacter parvulilacunae]